MSSTIKVPLPAEVSVTMEKHPEIDWASIAQKSLTDYARKIAIADALTRNSDMTDEDVSHLDDEVKKSILAKYS